MKNNLKVIHLEGNNYEIGYQHGKILSKYIKKSIETRYHHLKSNLNISLSEAIKESQKYLPDAEKYFPEYINEIEGIAKGANIPFEKVFFIQVASEFAYRPDTSCSAFAITPRYTEYNEVIIGQNWDTIKEYQTNLFIYNIKPINKPEMLMFGYAGVIGYMGINNIGVAHVVNSLKSSKWRYGVTHYFLHRKLYEMKKANEFIDLINNIPISSAANFLISDNQGTILDIEISPEGNRVIRSDKAVIHTNHFLHTELIKNEKFHEEIDSSKKRLRRLTYLINQRIPINLSKITSIMSDHENYPFSICRHSEDSSSMKTAASLIFFPQSGKIFISPGNPCNTEFCCYNFKS